MALAKGEAVLCISEAGVLDEVVGAAKAVA